MNQHNGNIGKKGLKPTNSVNRVNYIIVKLVH